MSELLKAEGLTKYYKSRSGGRFAAVDQVSLEIREGESLGLVGESGSGKSTLARLITRLTEPDEGRIWFNGRDITTAGGKELRQAYRDMQMIFQFPAESFDPRRRIGFCIGEALMNNGLSSAERNMRIGSVLEQCGLSAEYADRYPHELSGGECQRAAIARALVMNPKLLICDEATSALDATVQQQIMELLQSLKESSRLSFLFICHNPALVHSFCDRVLVMHNGRIVK